MQEKEPYRPGLVRNRNLVEQLKELQKNPRSLVFVSLAEAYRAEGLPHQSLEILEEGLHFHPGMASALIAKARCLFDLRRYGEASAECREIIRQNPSNIKAHKLLADICVRLGQRRAAIRALTQVVTLYPQDLEAVRALEELENLEAKQFIPPERISRASVDTPPPALGKIDDFQVGSFRESLASIPEQLAEGMLPPLAAAPALEVARPVPLPSKEEADEPGEPTFATRTIAELYLRQGLKRKAEKVLRKLLQDEPGNSWARETLQDLGTDEIVLPVRKPQVDPRRAALTAKAKVLERMLAQVRLRKAR